MTTPTESNLDEALDAACRIFTEDHQLIEALDAKARGDEYFQNDDGEQFDADITLINFTRSAHKAGSQCLQNGAPEVSLECFRIATDVMLAQCTTTHFCAKLIDLLPAMIASGRAALDAASVEAAK